MIYAGRVALLCAIALAAGAGAANAEGGGYGGEPVPVGPPVVYTGPQGGPPNGAAGRYSDKGFATPAPGGQSSMPDDAGEAYAEAQYVDGDPYGRTGYWQDGRGGRGGTQFGPGYYQKGYYHPGERQFPDYSVYDEERADPTLDHGLQARCRSLRAEPARDRFRQSFAGADHHENPH